MDEVIEALIAQLKIDVGMSYSYLYGKARKIPEAMLPLISVYPLQTSRKVLGTGGVNARRLNQFTIEVKILLHLKDYLDVNSNNTEIQHVRAIVQAMEQRSTTDATPLITTILGSIENFTDTNGIVDISPSIDIMYTEDAQQQVGSYYVPVTIRVTFTQMIPRPSTF